jgi:Spy/CpxP family protein refolding chaperone
MPARVTALFAVALVVFLGAPAAGQGFKWWQSDEFKKELGLTAAQTVRLEEIFQKALPKLKVQKTALDAAEAKFAALIERGDEGAMEQINVVEEARKALNTSRALMLWNMRQVLTTDQYAKLTALQHAAAARMTARPPEPQAGK